MINVRSNGLRDKKALRSFKNAGGTSHLSKSLDSDDEGNPSGLSLNEMSTTPFVFESPLKNIKHSINKNKLDNF